MNEKYYCPVNAWDCPCWHKDGSCDLEDAIYNCDDAAYYDTNYDWDEDLDLAESDVTYSTNGHV